MSLHALAAGSLIADPARRSGAKGDFATAILRASTEDGAILVSIIAFGAQAAQLLDHHQGDALAISGRTKLTQWTGRDGAEHHGLSMVIETIASAAGARRADVARRRERRDAA